MIFEIALLDFQLINKSNKKVHLDILEPFEGIEKNFEIHKYKSTSHIHSVPFIVTTFSLKMRSH